MALYGSAKAPAVPANADGSTVSKLGSTVTPATVDDIALSTSNTYTDAAVNTAVNAAIAQINAALAKISVAGTKLDALIDHLNDGRR